MKRFARAYVMCMFLTGLFLILCMGWPAGMVLLALFEGNPLLFWVLAALLPAVPALAWTAWKARPETSEGSNRNLQGNVESIK